MFICHFEMSLDPQEVLGTEWAMLSWDRYLLLSNQMLNIGEMKAENMVTQGQTGWECQEGHRKWMQEGAHTWLSLSCVHMDRVRNSLGSLQRWAWNNVLWGVSDWTQDLMDTNYILYCSLQILVLNSKHFLHTLNVSSLESEYLLFIVYATE